MSRTIQFKRRQASEIANTVGANGEIIIDITNNTVTVHDGVTLGGHALPNDAYIDGKIADLVDGAPGLLDTLKELADAINDDPNFFSNVQSSITTANANMKLYVDGQISGLSSNTVNTAFVESQVLAANNWLQANDFITLTQAKSYTDTANNWLQANDASTLVEAKSYTDSSNNYNQAYTNTSNAYNQLYTEAANTNLKSYVDGKIVTLNSNISSNLSTAQSYTDTANVYNQTYTNNTVSSANSDMKIYVDTSISALINSAPATLDTLKELADALGDDANFANTILTVIGTKANTSALSNVAFTGDYNDLTNVPEGYSNTNVALYLANYDGAINFTASPAIISGVGTLSTYEVFVGGRIVSPTTNLIFDTANAAFNRANSANVLAQAAFDTANGNVSILVNGAYSVSLSNTGTVTLPTGGTIEDSASYIKLTPAGGTTDTQALLIYPTAVDGNHIHLAAPFGSATELYLGNDAQYVKLVNGGNIEVRTLDGLGANPTWAFSNTGTFTLPAGGVIAEGGGISGAIRLTPAGGGNANQTLLIYPTGNAEGDHVHLTAGGGSTELYLGNDFHYVKLVNGGNVELRATTANLSDQAAWTFDTTGNIDTIQALGIKVPNGVPSDVAVINSTTGSWEANPRFDLATTGGSGTGLTVNVTEVGGYASTIEIADAGTGYKNGDLITVTSGTSNATFTIVIGGRNTWTFGIDGSLTLPIGVSIDSSVSSLYPKIIADSGKLFSVQGQGANGSAALAWSLNPNTDTQYAAVGVNKGGGDNLAKVVLTAGNTTPELKVWKFDETGAFTFPDNTVQTTAYTTEVFDRANSANALAQAAFNYANTIISDTQIDQYARDTANTASNNIVILQGVNTTQNNNITSANVLAQAAFDAANTAGNGMDQFARDTANSANVLAQAAFNQANTESGIQSYANSNVVSLLSSFGSNNITTTGNVTSNNIVANNITVNQIITSSNIIGTSANVTITAGSYVSTFDTDGTATFPGLLKGLELTSTNSNGNEGGQINLANPAANTTLGGTGVTVDVYQNQFRIFEGGSAKGVYVDLSKAPAGVGGELLWKTSGLIDAGTFLTLDNLKVTVPTSNNRGLSIASVSGSFVANIGAWYGGSGGVGGDSTNNLSVTTTESGSLFSWNFVAEGNSAQYTIYDKTNNRMYRVTLMIGPAYLNNFISIEGLA